MSRRARQISWLTADRIGRSPVVCAPAERGGKTAERSGARGGFGVAAVDKNAKNYFKTFDKSAAGGYNN